MTMTTARRRSLRLAFATCIAGAMLGAVACGSSSSPSAPPPGGDGTPTIDDPRAPLLVGTGTVDVFIADAPPADATAKAYGVAWWEVELQLDGDVASDTAPAVSASDATRTSIVFWGHDETGRAVVEGQLAIDLARWLSLRQEHDPTDVAQIFDGSDARYSNGGGLDDEERTAVFQSILAAVDADTALPATTGKSLRPGARSTHAALSTLTSCAGDAKKAVHGALTALGKKFGTCAACASEAIDSLTSDVTWKACGACESTIGDASGLGGLFDFLACKKALVVPPADEDSVVKRPDALADATCWSTSSDKVHGTFRVTDAKGSVSCDDCPAGTTPIESMLGCAPSDPTAGSIPDESKAIVAIPAGAGKPATPRVITRDACILTEITSTGTVNGTPVDAGPRRALYKIGERSWGALPRVKTRSVDEWDLTADHHASSTPGVFSIDAGADKSARPATAPTRGTVDQAIARGGCSSEVVLGLSQQILEELSRCVKPGELVKVAGNSKLDTSATALPYLEKPAAAALVKAAAASPAKIWVNHMFRAVSQQYFISKVGSNPACGIKAWARPGFSNHETGIALDIANHDAVRAALEAAGYRWFGSGDPVHFDFVGAGAVDLRGNDVRAFQRLWNRNHPEDKIAEDGSYGPDTQKRLGMSPANGFPIGTPDSCAREDATFTGGASRAPLQYLTNVTTADLFPGRGCESGKDASHTDVNACLTSKAVCAPYWCDLADRVLPTCGASAKAPVEPPSSPAPASAPTCAPLGTFRMTYYYIAVESDFGGPKDTPMYGRDGAVLATEPLKFVKASRLEGTGKLSSGPALNWSGKCAYSEYGCFTPLDPKYANGQGASGRGLRPYHSIAVDPSVIPLGTRVYAKELAGKTMPDGTIHDGWLVADDTGGAILGEHIDFFVQDRAAYHAIDGALRLTHVTLVPEKC
ncbi:MAG: hypothetical protein NVSMB47_02690 [Polyangiales bacterium]